MATEPNKPIETSSKEDFDSLHCLIQLKDAKIHKIKEKFHEKLEKLNNDLYEEKLKNKSLMQEMMALKKAQLLAKEQHAKQLQDIQYRHEKKLQRVKQDVDNYLSELYEKAALYVTEKLKILHKKEILNLKDQYEDIINNIRTEYEIEIEEKDSEYSKLMEQFENMDPTEEFTEEYSDQYSEIIKTHVQNQTNKKLKDRKIKSKKCETLVLQISEQKSIIEAQQRIIDDLSKDLQETFKRKSRISSASTRSGHLKSQKSFQGLLDQISCFLDTADPNTSRELEETIKGIQSRKASSEKLSF